MNKKSDYIVCIDSDGCAMNTMDLKHQKCFAPLVLEHFAIAEPQRFIEIWHTINLFSQTRGINRFKGLVLSLQQYSYEQDITPLVNWVNTTQELSNRSLAKEIELHSHYSLVAALAWSNAVNQAIKQLRTEDAPFDNVLRSLLMIHQFADIAVVSSANNEAIIDEWTRHQLLPYVDIVFGQEQGSKAFCLEQLKQQGYSAKHILMVGDSPGDLSSAQETGVNFFPILCKHENMSWDKLVLEGLGKLVSQHFDDEYQQQLITAFNQNLTA